MTITITGGRPSGKLHLGHYFSSFLNFIEHQGKDETLLIIADTHYLTAMCSKEEIARILPNTMVMVRDAIAMGVDPSKTSIYLQSAVPDLPRISLIFEHLVTVESATSIFSYRMNTKVQDGSKNTVSLVAYPVLEAADVFSVSADNVMVGKDNVEHIIMAQNLVRRLNEEYGGNFNYPQYVTDPRRNYIRGTDGKEKMSKSLGNVIFADETTDGVIEKITKMPWVDKTANNLVAEYLRVLNPEREFPASLSNFSETELKKELIEGIEDVWAPMRERREKYNLSNEEIIELLRKGTSKVSGMAAKRCAELEEVLGLPTL